MIERFKYKTHLAYLVSEEITMEKILEIGTVSSRGQIAIPADVRRVLALNDGERVLFAVDGDALIIKKLDVEKTWSDITKPLREAAKKAGLKEADAAEIVHRFRKANAE
jgi:AbrB family looped-hinge helix DNA binding protein